MRHWHIALAAQYETEATTELSYNIPALRFCGKGYCTIDWGDGTVEKRISLTPEQIVRLPYYDFDWEWEYPRATLFSHRYAALGDYSLRISGSDGFPTLFFCTLGTFFAVYDHAGIGQRINSPAEENRYTALRLENCTKLQYLDCSRNFLTNLDIRTCSQLKELSCHDNRLTELNLHSCPKLEVLKCNKNQLTELDLSRCPELEVLQCCNNQLTELDLRGCPKLAEGCDKNPFCGPRPAAHKG